MKLGWSGFRSAFAFAIIAVKSAAEANSFGGGGGFWAVSCRAIAAVISRVRIVQRTRRRMRPPVRRRLYSIRVSPGRAQRCRPCATDVIGRRDGSQSRRTKRGGYGPDQRQLEPHH